MESEDMLHVTVIKVSHSYLSYPLYQFARKTCKGILKAFLHSEGGITQLCEKFYVISH